MITKSYRRIRLFPTKIRRNNISKATIVLKSIRNLHPKYGSARWDKIIDFSKVPFVSNRVMPGVYMIGDVYIGASKHIKNRIKQHIKNCSHGYPCNKRLSAYITERLKNGLKVEVTMLDPDPYQEFYYYKKHFGEPPKSLCFYHQTYKNNLS